jgi:hypothetical protein
LDELNEIDKKLIQQVLKEQDQEAESGFTATSTTLAGLITSRPESWLRAVGVSLLRSKMPSERILGSRMLRELKSERDSNASLIAEQLRVEDQNSVTVWLLYALAFLHVQSTLPIVLEFANHESPEVREAVPDAISGCSGESLPPSGRDALLLLAVDANDQVRFSAVFELGRWWTSGLVDPQIHKALIQAKVDSHKLVRDAAADALRQAL